MSNVPVMPLSGGGDIFAELFKAWDDPAIPVQWEEIPAEIMMNSSGYPSGHLSVPLDESFFPNLTATTQRMVVLAFLWHRAIYESEANFPSSGYRLIITGAQLYWSYKNTGVLNNVGAESLMKTSGTTSDATNAMYIEARPSALITSGSLTSVAKPSYNNYSHLLDIPFDYRTFSASSGCRVEIPFLRVFLIRQTT